MIILKIFGEKIWSGETALISWLVWGGFALWCQSLQSLIYKDLRVLTFCPESSKIGILKNGVVNGVI